MTNSPERLWRPSPDQPPEPASPWAPPTGPAAEFPPPLPPPPLPQLPEAPYSAPTSASSNDRGLGVTRKGVIVVALVAVTSALIGAAAAVIGMRTSSYLRPTTSSSAALPPAAVGSGSNDESTIVRVADQVLPSVVQVESSASGSFRAGDSVSSGSGFVIREDGYVLTNNHVVDGAKSVRIKLANGDVINAKVSGTDPDFDTALLKSERSGLPPASLGTARNLQVGQTVIAIGSPGGLPGGPSVGVGVVSALGRKLDFSGSTLEALIQTDAPINHGSSGGALVDANGNVVGITTGGISTDIGAQGLGFAVPIDVARHSAEQIIATGKVAHSYAGIKGTSIDASTAKVYGTQPGGKIEEVESGSPAEAAGMHAGDLVIGADGEKVASIEQLVLILRSHDPGDEVGLLIVRAGATQDLRMKLGSKAR